MLADKEAWRVLVWFATLVALLGSPHLAFVADGHAVARSDIAAADAEAGQIVMARLAENGIETMTGADITGLEVQDRKLAAVSIAGDALPAQAKPCDLLIIAKGVEPNKGLIGGTLIQHRTGIITNARMQTNLDHIYAAGDVAESTDCVTGERMVNAIQPNAVEQGRIAALNMAGQPAQFRGSFVFNVLTTLGLVSSSFGEWQGVPNGEATEVLDEARYRYLNLQFEGDRLVGANCVGFADHVGAFRGLIEGRVRLGKWKQRLLEDPTRIMEAYLAAAHRVA